MQQLTVTPLYPETSLSAKRFLQLRRMTVQRWIAKALKLPGTPQGLRQAAEYAEGMRRVGVASIDDFGRVSDSTMWHDCPPELRVPKEGGLWDRLMQERLKLLKAIRAREAAEPALLLPEAATRAYDNAVRWRVQNVRVAFGREGVQAIEFTHRIVDTAGRTYDYTCGSADEALAWGQEYEDFELHKHEHIKYFAMCYIRNTEQDRAAPVGVRFVTTRGRSFDAFGTAHAGTPATLREVKFGRDDEVVVGLRIETWNALCERFGVVTAPLMLAAGPKESSEPELGIAPWDELELERAEAERRQQAVNELRRIEQEDERARRAAAALEGGATADDDDFWMVAGATAGRRGPTSRSTAARLSAYLGNTPAPAAAAVAPGAVVVPPQAPRAVAGTVLAIEPTGPPAVRVVSGTIVGGHVVDGTVLGGHDTPIHAVGTVVGAASGFEHLTLNHATAVSASPAAAVGRAMFVRGISGDA